MSGVTPEHAVAALGAGGPPAVPESWRSNGPSRNQGRSELRKMSMETEHVRSTTQRQTLAEVR